MATRLRTLPILPLLCSCAGMFDCPEPPEAGDAIVPAAIRARGGLTVSRSMDSSSASTTFSFEMSDEAHDNLLPHMKANAMALQLNLRPLRYELRSMPSEGGIHGSCDHYWFEGSASAVLPQGEDPIRVDLTRNGSILRSWLYRNRADTLTGAALRCDSAGIDSLRVSYSGFGSAHRCRILVCTELGSWHFLSSTSADSIRGSMAFSLMDPLLRSKIGDTAFLRQRRYHLEARCAPVAGEYADSGDIRYALFQNKLFRIDTSVQEYIRRIDIKNALSSPRDP